MFKSRILVSISTAIVAMAIFAFMGCGKGTISALPGENISYTTDHALLARTFNDAQTIADQAVKINATTLGSCVTVNLDTISQYPIRIVTVNFGTTNCLNADGKHRHGKMAISWIGKYDDSSVIKHISFDQYYVDSNFVNGKIDFRNLGVDSFNHPVTAVTITDGSISYTNDSAIVGWSAKLTRTWLDGYKTSDIMDDSYQLTGSGTMQRQNIESKIVTYSTTTVNYGVPLLIAMNCKFIEQGTVLFTIPHNNNVRTLDYGNGACDGIATINVDNQVYNILFK